MSKRNSKIKSMPAKALNELRQKTLNQESRQFKGIEQQIQQTNYPSKGRYNFENEFEMQQTQHRMEENIFMPNESFVIEWPIIENELFKLSLVENVYLCLLFFVSLTGKKQKKH